MSSKDRQQSDYHARALPPVLTTEDVLRRAHASVPRTQDTEAFWTAVRDAAGKKGKWTWRRTAKACEALCLFQKFPKDSVRYTPATRHVVGHPPEQVLLVTNKLPDPVQRREHPGFLQSAKPPDVLLYKHKLELAPGQDARALPQYSHRSAEQTQRTVAQDIQAAHELRSRIGLVLGCTVLAVVAGFAVWLWLGVK